MTLSAAAIASIAGVLVTITLSFLLYTNQVMDNLRKVLDSNKPKRDKATLGLLTEAKKTLDHIAASIREEVMEDPSWVSELKASRLNYYKERCLHAFYSIDDAKDIRESLRITLRSLAKVRGYMTFLLGSITIATLTLSISGPQYFEGLAGLWSLIFFFEIPLLGYWSFDYYKDYKLVRDLLSEHRVGVHDEIN